MTPTTIGTSSVVLMGIRSLAYTQRVSGERLGNYSDPAAATTRFGVNGSIPLGIDRFPGSLGCALLQGPRDVLHRHSNWATLVTWIKGDNWGSVEKAVGIGRDAVYGNMKLSSQAARSMG